MRHLRLIIPLVLGVLVSYNTFWTKHIYAFAEHSSFAVLGTLDKFEIPCTALPNSVSNECAKAFQLTKKQMQLEDPNSVVGVGIGVLIGGANWYCDTGDGKNIKFYQSGSDSSQITFRDGLFLYQSGMIPLSICKNNIWISVVRDSQNSTGVVGWKSGALVRGLPTIIASYKTVNDFFSSYLRAFLSVITLLLLLIFRSVFNFQAPGEGFYRSSLIFYSVHFISSSSLFDFIFPNKYGFGFSILMAGGTGGVFLMLLCYSEMFLRKKINLGRYLKKASFLFSPFLFFGLVVFYRFLPDGCYVNVQFCLALTLLSLNLVFRAPSFFVYSILLTADVLASKGILSGLPTNVSTHFLFFNFIYDSFEWVFRTSSLMERLSNGRISVEQANNLIVEISDRFFIKRRSISIFTKEHEFKTYLLETNIRQVLDVRGGVSHIAGSVMTSRQAAFRLRVNSKEFLIRRGEVIPESRNIFNGSECSIFPIVHSDKVLGVLNLTDYPDSSLGDPSQVSLFSGLINRMLPALAESYYREDLSPNIDEQKDILEIESLLGSQGSKTRLSVSDAFDAMASKIDCKILISRAITAEGRFETYSTHNYLKFDDNYLKTHSIKIEGDLVLSPANLAFSRSEFIYIDDVKQMYSFYSEYVVGLFKRNETKTLVVQPVIYKEKEIPWGVIWIEFSNKFNRPDSDLKELSLFLCSSIQRILVSHVEYEIAEKLKNELSSLIPQHVLNKMKMGQDPREAEQGYLLNIDLSGSTKLAKEIGDEKYGIFIKGLFDKFSKNLAAFDLTPQMIIWDAFIFTKNAEKSTFSVVDQESILNTIKLSLDQEQSLFEFYTKISFRAVLHYGDTTRDFKPGEIKAWGIVGSALAESCKIEASMKGRIEVLFVSEACGETENELFLKVA